MKRTVSLALAILFLAACILPAAGHTEASADSVLYCSNCGKRIPSDSKYCMYCGHKVSYSYPTSTPAPTWGSWSSWKDYPVYASSTRQVETRRVITEYHMVHYGTQTDSSPHYRVFRNYSINGKYEAYGARSSYGEKHYTRSVSPSMLDKAVTYEPGVLIKGDYAGYQRGTDTAYYFGDDKYVWFIESYDYTTQYRYRDAY